MLFTNIVDDIDFDNAKSVMIKDKEIKPAGENLNINNLQYNPVYIILIRQFDKYYGQRKVHGSVSKEFDILCGIVYRVIEMALSKKCPPFIQQEFINAFNNKESVFEKLKEINFSSNSGWIEKLGKFLKDDDANEKPIPKEFIDVFFSLIYQVILQFTETIIPSKKASDAEIIKLADIFCISIEIYKKSGESTDKYKTKLSLFKDNLVLSIIKDTMILYTQSQGREFANDDQNFNKAKVKGNYKPNEEAKGLPNVTKDVAASLLDLTKRTEKIISGLSNFGKTRKIDEFSKAIKDLLNSSFLKLDFKNDKSFSLLEKNFTKSMINMSDNFNDEEGIENALDALESNLTKPSSRKCDECGKECSLYKSFAHKCGHILDQACFEKCYFIKLQGN